MFGLDWNDAYTPVEILCPGTSFVTGVNARTGLWLDAVGPLNCSKGGTTGPAFGNIKGGTPWIARKESGFTFVSIRWFNWGYYRGISWVRFPDSDGYGFRATTNGNARNLSCPASFVIAGLQAWVAQDTTIVALGLICRAPGGRAVIQPLYGGCAQCTSLILVSFA